MPLDGAYFIKDLNPANPVGTIDKVSLLDDIIREVKGSIVNTFPDMDGEVKYSTDELNEMKSNFVLEDEQWDLKGNALTGVGEPVDEEDETAVLNKGLNDSRYLMVENNLSDIKDISEAFDNLFKEVDYTSDGMKSFKVVMTNLMYPVGSIYMNVQSDQNPAEYLGVGKWIKFAEGRALIGTGELNDGTITKKFEAGNITGTFEHTLTVDQMPAHTHSFKQLRQEGPGPDTKHNFTIAQKEQASYNTESAGGSKPHNNMQPSIAVHIWRRTE